MVWVVCGLARSIASFIAPPLGYVGEFAGTEHHTQVRMLRQAGIGFGPKRVLLAR
jgi:hypothetical protein